MEPSKVRPIDMCSRLFRVNEDPAPLPCHAHAALGLAPSSTSGYTVASPVACNGGRHELGPVEGNWKQMAGKVKTKWGELADDDLTAINGKREQLEGKLQERYGIAKDQARKEVDDWFRAQTW